MSQFKLISLLVLLAPLCSAFVVPTTSSVAFVKATATAKPASVVTLAMHDSSQLLAADTIDPTTVLSDALGGVMNSPAILAVPIVAALGVAFVIGFLIFAYAAPQVEEDEYE